MDSRDKYDEDRERRRKRPREEAPRSASRLKWIFAGVFIAAAAAGGALAVTSALQGSSIAGGLTKADRTSPAENAATGEGIFADHARQAGLQKCPAFFAGLGRALVGDGAHSAMTRWDETAPDSHAVHSLVGMQFGNDGLTAGGVVFVAPTSAGCEGSLTRIVPSAITCDQMAALLPQGSKPAANLTGAAVFSLPDGGSALLVPGPSGCVLVTSVAARTGSDRK